jgi:predicted amidophosphoribosyltransferase
VEEQVEQLPTQQGMMALLLDNGKCLSCKRPFENREHGNRKYCKDCMKMLPIKGMRRYIINGDLQIWVRNGVVKKALKEGSEVSIVYSGYDLPI